jgi:tetratricopeptide (TPR) repeat protein
MHQSEKKVIVLFFILIFLFMNVFLFADEKQQLFEQGNLSFQNQQYLEALASYQKILDLKYESGPLYYNMGNCYYKLGNIGKAILFYERALRLMPGDEDLKENMALANLSVVDKLEEPSQFILFRIRDFMIHLIPWNILLWAVAGCYLLTMFFLILWIVARGIVLRVVSMRVMIVTGVLFAVFGLALIGQIAERKNKIEAVIMTDKVDVMSAPAEIGGTEVFSLHEGTKVRIDQTKGGWVEIILPDRKAGWVKSEVLEVI